MRGLVVVASLLVTFAAAPATAGFGGEYQGRLEGDPQTFIGFDVDKVSGHKKVRHVEFLVPVNCRQTGNQFHLPASIEGSFRVRHRRFHGTHDILTKGEGTATIRGRLRSHGRAAGTLDVLYRGGLTRCYSGTLSWHAKRGATVTPPPKR